MTSAAASAPLPSSRGVLSSLISELENTPPPPPPPPPSSKSTSTTAPLSFASLPPPLRSLLLTLHCLLPTTLLPALDILDRRHVSKVSCPTHSVFYVRSAGALHEVRTRTWSCSCAALAFDAASWKVDEDANEIGVKQNEGDVKDGDTVRGIWGGLMREGLKRWEVETEEGTGGVPVCKHIVACVLAERCEMFRPLVERKVVSVEEMAGMAVVWEDGG